MIDLLKQFGDQPHPFHWAAFTLVGDGSTPIFKETNHGEWVAKLN